MRQRWIRHASVLIAIAAAGTLVGCSNTEPAAPTASMTAASGTASSAAASSGTAEAEIPPSTTVADTAPTDAAPPIVAPTGVAPTEVAPTDAATGVVPAEVAPVDAAPKTAAPGGEARLTVTAIRIGRHEGFDRVVYELGGTGTPGWRVGYVDQAVQDGSGKIVPVAGHGILQVLIDGSAYPFDSGAEPYAGPNPVVAEPGGVVTEVNGSGVFEGVTQSFIGVTEAGRPFRVSALTGPTRVVVDVAH